MRCVCWLVICFWAVVGCSSPTAPAGTSSPGGGASILTNGDPFDVPFDGVTKLEVGNFVKGDELFGIPFRPSDGLGPLYIRSSCGSCHAEATRGPGLVEKM